MKRHSLVLLVGLLLAAAPALAAKKPIDVTRSVTANATIRISNMAGKLKIVGWDKNAVHVTGTLGSAYQTLEVTGGKDSLEITVRYPNYSNNNSSWSEPGSDLVVQVPRAAAIRASTISAPITAGDLAGKLRLQSVSGNIDVTSKASEINAQSVSGNVDVNGSAAGAHVEANSVSGFAHVSNVTGELTAQSVSGSVKADNSRLSRATLNSTSGLAEFNSPIEANGTYKFNTVSGRIVINLPKQPDAEFDIMTFAGSIHNNFGPKPEKVSMYTSSVKLHFTSGKGGAYVHANSMSGEIVLKAGS